ncbi:unnamed protein product [Lactuca saligna]|uniref:Uncharacterized protein n=1 Tax=Lactuca saligna TaxID=75948 RepID=A0AA36EK10_LACSI|nr:unnamed protein product [Lactuca saligna]
MLQLVSESKQLLIHYKYSMDLTSSGPIPMKSVKDGSKKTVKVVSEKKVQGGSKKLRAQTFEKTSTIATPISNTFEADHDSKEDANVTIDDETLTSSLDTITIPPPPPSSPPPTSTITPTIIPVISPTFAGIINEPINSLFFSQSTDQELLNNEEDELVEFAELKLDPEEVNVDDNSIMSRKQYKILNFKLNIILLSLNDNVGKSSMSGEGGEFLVKSQELKMKTLINSIVINLEESLATQSSSYKHEVKEL